MSGITRRDFLGQSIGAGVAGSAAMATGAAGAAEPPPKGLPQFRPDGSYETVPLRSDHVSVAMLQTRVMPVDGKNPAPDIKANLEHMLWAIDAAQGYGPRKDLLAFHEFPITGWAKWTRQEILRFALEVPGPETERLGEKAREYGCYISFGTYAQDRDWPRHVISMSVIIGPDGQVVSRQWKHRNIHSAFAEFELFTSSVYDVLERYVEMYGWDAVIPVARTDIGNICVSACQWEPDLYRAMALKGGELLIRTSSGGIPFDMGVMARVNRVYTGLVNNAVSPGNRYFLEAAGGGGSAVFGPNGLPIAQAGHDVEESVEARIPLAEFRRTHRVPDRYNALYRHVLDVDHPRFAPGAFLEHLPETLEESAQYFRRKARW
jgi:predicted amidohydrolase